MHTDSAPDAAGVADSSFFCFGFAFAKELNRLPFSRCAGAVFSVGLEAGALLRCEDGAESERSSFLGSGFICCDVSFGRFEGTVDLDEEGAGAGGVGAGGRAPVLRCESYYHIGTRQTGVPYLHVLILNHAPLFPKL